MRKKRKEESNLGNLLAAAVMRHHTRRPSARKQPQHGGEDSGDNVPQYTDAVQAMALFQQFQDLRLANDAEKKTLAPEKILVPFERDGTIFKTQLLLPGPDSRVNAAYTYFVGKYFVNVIADRMPCFVQTLGLYNITHKDTFNALCKRDPTLVRLAEVMQLAPPAPNSKVFWQTACTKTQAVLTEKLPVSLYIGYFLGDKPTVQGRTAEEFLPDIAPMQFQVYFALVALFPRFTHHNLNRNTVVAYQPFGEKQYIVMRYHDTCTGRVFEFPTQYMAKIIDYNNSFFNNEEKVIGSFDLPDSAFVNTGIPAAHVAGFRTNSHRMANSDIVPSCKVLNNRALESVVGDAKLPMRSMFTLALKTNKPNASSDLRSFRAGSMLPMNSFLDDENIFVKLESLAQQLASPEQAALLQSKYNADWKLVAEIDVYDDGRPYDARMV